MRRLARLAGAGMLLAAASAARAADAPGMAGMDSMPMPQSAPAPATGPSEPPPAWDGTWAADRDYDPAAMAEARTMMRREMGGMPQSKVMLNLAEYQAGPQGGGYRWDGEAWAGGDYDRMVLRSEGEGAASGGLETAEVQVLYSRAVGPRLDLQAGVRQDVAPAARTALALGGQALLPLWFEVEGAVFVATDGEVLARAEGAYDLRLTQRLVLQPRAELNFAARDSARMRTGAGLSDAELGLRLRYEIRHRLAPYVGVSWERRLGRTADYWRAAGEGGQAASFVVGVRSWF